jgi:hypothetical protein
MTLARMNIPNIVVVKREKAPSKSMRPNEEKIKATMNFIPEAMHNATSHSHSGHEERLDSEGHLIGHFLPITMLHMRRAALIKVEVVSS